MKDLKVLDCSCGSCNVEVDWDDESLPDEYISEKEYFVECYSCGKKGKPAPSYDLAIRNWNKIV